MQNLKAVMACFVVAVIAGCATGYGSDAMNGTSSERTADATIAVDGLTCPSCVYGFEDTLKRVDGVLRIETDLNTGRARVWYAPDTSPEMKALWDAVNDSGFTPRKITSADGAYAGD